MSVKDELLAIKGDSEVLVVEEAWQWARDNPASDLHAAIEWNQTKAAKKYQLWQVRQLIALHIVNVNDEREAISLSIDRVRPGGGYRMIDDVIPTVDLRECMLRDALADLQRLQLKYNRLTELARVWEEAEALRRRRRGGHRRGGERDTGVSPLV